MPINNSRLLPLKPTDDELIAAYAGGTADAFDALYARYRERVYSYCFRALSYDESQAADCCQEIWMKVIKAASTYRSNGHFDRWLFGLAHNCLVDRYRQQSKMLLSDSDDEAVSLENFVHRFEQCDNLQTALQKLPLAQRSALLLHYCEGYSLTEIADLQSISTQTIKSRLRYGLSKVRGWLGEDHV